MKMMLAENIRAFRKERSLTQEQLSEALGVTAGAVYKWEAKLSIPELELIWRTFSTSPWTSCSAMRSRTTVWRRR